MSSSSAYNENDLDYIFPPETIIINNTEHHLYQVFLPTEIGEYIELEDIIRLLRSHKVQGQFINLHIRGFGGCTMIGQELINAINSSLALINPIVTANVYSMHTIIALSQAESLEIEDNVQFMFHEAQIEVGGGLANVIRDVKSQQSEDDMLNLYIKPYLTKSEYSDMLKGLNIYVNGTEMKKRIAALHPKETQSGEGEEDDS